MFFDKDASGRIQWTLELKLINISNNSSVPCLLRTCLDKKTLDISNISVSETNFLPPWTIFSRCLELSSKHIARIRMFNVLIRFLSKFLLPNTLF